RPIRFVVIEQALTGANGPTITTGPKVREAIQVFDEVSQGPAGCQLQICGDEWTLIFEDDTTERGLDRYLRLTSHAEQFRAVRSPN
ncbi:MAG TPA: hypothetical protein VI259_15470, partial [Gemmatimonadaceae bacterium]